MLNKDFSCGGLDLQNPRFLGGGWVHLFITPRICVTFGIVWCVGDVSKFEPSKLDKPSTVAGVQGEVYQADLLGIGTVAVKISRRNDDYAKGDLVAGFESFEGVWHWPYSYLTPSDWISMMASKGHANLMSVALLDDAISLFLINDETELAHHFRSLKCMHFNSERAFPFQKPRWSNCWMTHWSMLTANMTCQVWTLFHTLAMYVAYNCTACLANNVHLWNTVNGERRIDSETREGKPERDRGREKNKKQKNKKRKIYIHYVYIYVINLYIYIYIYVTPTNIVFFGRSFHGRSAFVSSV